jgi:hypothetical protein
MNRECPFAFYLVGVILNLKIETTSHSHKKTGPDGESGFSFTVVAVVTSVHDGRVNGFILATSDMPVCNAHARSDAPTTLSLLSSLLFTYHYSLFIIPPPPALLPVAEAVS